MNLWYSEAQNRGTHGGDRLWTVCMVWVSQFLCGRVFFNWMWTWQSLLAVVHYASCNGWPGYELENGIGSESQLVEWLEDHFFHQNLVRYPECWNKTASEYSELHMKLEHQASGPIEAMGLPTTLRAAWLLLAVVWWCRFVFNSSATWQIWNCLFFLKLVPHMSPYCVFIKYSIAYSLNIDIQYIKKIYIVWSRDDGT